MKPKMEIRIWNNSPLIGKTVKEIDDKFKVKIIKVSRGIKATNPSPSLKLEEADYIRYIGKTKNCLKVLNNSILE